MTNRAERLLPAVLARATLVACGTNPYVGDSTSTNTSTQTWPKTDTGTGPVIRDGGVDVPAVGPDDDVISTVVGTARPIDLVLMIDNSPSMAPKVAKLNAAFPALLTALRYSDDGTLPDLRVAIIDSDLGTACQYASGTCGPKDAVGVSGCFGDQGIFQTPQGPTGCALAPGAQFLEVKNDRPVNFTGEMSNVFACLTGNLGTLGCGLEHQLQAFQFALAAKGVGTEDQQAAFLRPEARLGLVFLTDEDDCSAATNDGMFGDLPLVRGESASLRCATRAHSCGGVKLSESGPGYPTTSAFTHPFDDCRARTDSCPNRTVGMGSDATDTSVPTACSPLVDVKGMADDIKRLKADPNDVIVAGIFGWPRSDADMASAQYKIAPVPNPNLADTLHPTVYDYWPICYDPDHMPSPATTDPTTGFDATAAGWGATGGLREAAFVDQFGENGQKFSICERDLTVAMRGIGYSFPKLQSPICFPYKPIDVDLATPGVQPDCRVVRRTPEAGVYTEEALPVCPAGASNGNVATDCWQFVTDTAKCGSPGRLVQVFRTAEELANNLYPAFGTKVGIQCRTCESTPTDPGCAY